MESRYQWYRQNSSWEYEPVKSTKRVADGDLTLAADKPARVSLAPQPGRYRLDVKSTEADGPVTSVQFDVGWYSDGSADTPDLLETSIDKPEYAVRRHHGGVGQCPHGRQAHHQRARRPPADDADRRRQGRHPAGQAHRRQGLGHRRLCAGDAAPSARCGGAADAGAGDRAEMVRHRQEDAHAAVDAVAAAAGAARHGAEDSGQARRAQSRRGRQDRRRRGRCRHSQSDQLQAAGAGRLLSRPAPPDVRNPRPLRAIDRRHAGHARPDQDRRRFRRRRAAGLAADAKAAGALFRDRHGRRRRHRRNQFRHSGVRRHRARDGGGVELRPSSAAPRSTSRCAIPWC